MKPNQISFDGGMIVIQSCDKDVANIGVFQDKYQGKSAYHHVSIPELVREFSLCNYTELTFEEYDRILSENKEAVLEAIHKLNLTVPRNL